MELSRLKQINFKQGKYLFPLFLYIPIIGCIYLFYSAFTTKVEHPSTGGLEKTEYLNSKIPDAHLKGDGIGDKRSNMENQFGLITDLSAVETVEREEEQKEEYESKYTDEDLAFMLAQQRFLDEELMRDSLRRVIEAEMGYSQSPVKESVSHTPSSEALQQAEIDSALARIYAEASHQARLADSLSMIKETTNTDVVNTLTDNDDSKEVVKKGRTSSTVFYTIGEQAETSNLIQAIVDEDVTATDGSRIRLRLLDDVMIDGQEVPSGTYMYATVNGFGTQRVTGQITSVLVGDVLVKISLSLYDTDGLEGLFVPTSEFRKTGKEVAAGALQGGNLVSGTGYGGDNLSQFVMQGLQNAYQQTSSAISRAIRKNKAKIKYGTFVYLVNKNDNK